MRASAYFALAATMLLWSGNWIVGRAVRDDITPALASLGRVAIVIACLAPFAWRGLREKLAALRFADWRLLFAAGFLGGGVHLGLQWLGLRYTTATSATLYISTSPIWILVLSHAFLSERIAGRQWLGVAISFAGVAVVATEGRLASAAHLSLNVGDLLALTAMVMWAGYTVLLPRRRDTLDTVQFIVLVASVGGLTLLPWVAWELAHDARASLSGRGIAAFVYSGVGSFLLAYLGWSYAVSRIGAARSGAWMHLMPAFGVLLAAIFLGERPRAYHFAGIALILAGVGLSSAPSARARRGRGDAPGRQSTP